MTNTELNDLITQVRRDILRMVHKVNSGHPEGLRLYRIYSLTLL